MNAEVTASRARATAALAGDADAATTGGDRGVAGTKATDVNAVVEAARA